MPDNGFVLFLILVSGTCSLKRCLSWKTYHGMLVAVIGVYSIVYEKLEGSLLH